MSRQQHWPPKFLQQLVNGNGHVAHALAGGVVDGVGHGGGHAQHAYFAQASDDEGVDFSSTLVQAMPFRARL